jgi:hypothetical protein
MVVALRCITQFQVTTHQLSIMLLFNDKEIWSYADLQEATSLPELQLTRALKAFVAARILLQSPKSSTITTKDSYKVNTQFRYAKLKVKIANMAGDPVGSGGTAATTTGNTTAIEQDRKLFLTALIVRIMKARKSLTHTQLLQEVFEQAAKHFVPNVALVKRCVETLIEQVGVEGRSVFLFILTRLTTLWLLLLLLPPPLHSGIHSTRQTRKWAGPIRLSGIAETSTRTIDFSTTVAVVVVHYWSHACRSASLSSLVGASIEESL